MLQASEMIEDLQESLLCNTDASKTTDNKAGIGIYIPKKNISLRTSSHSCISSIELAVVEDLLVHVKDSYQAQAFDIVILNDSLSALEALKDCNHIDRDNTKTPNINFRNTRKWQKGNIRLGPCPRWNPWQWESWCISKSRHYQGTDRPLALSVYQECQKVDIIQQWQTRWVAVPRSQHHKTIEKFVSTKSKFQCAKGGRGFNLKIPDWKICSESPPVSLKASSRRKIPGMPQEDENVRKFPHGMSGPVSPEGRNKTPNKSIWDELHA